jgi:DNA-binding transcriptional regulator YiaG
VAEAVGTLMASLNYRVRVPFTDEEFARLRKELKPNESNSTLVRRLLPGRLKIDSLPVGRPRWRKANHPQPKTSKVTLSYKKDNPMTGSQLKKLREQIGLSQAELADALGVATMTVSRWEREVQAPPPYVELALAELKRRVKKK